MGVGGMTGPEHYREAERLIDGAHKVQNDSGPGCGSEELLTEALVHATLALAAAVGGLDAIEGPGGSSATGRTAKDGDAWMEIVEPGGPW